MNGAGAMARAVVGAGCLVLAALSGGCLERRVSITTEPPGALVYANDVELGRTPLEADFTYYGTYDVRVELEGYEPLRTKARADVPIYEIPPLDLIAMAMPFEIETNVKWHFVLQPSVESTMDAKDFEAGLMERARAMRGEVEPKPEEKAMTPAEKESPQTAAEPPK